MTTASQPSDVHIAQAHELVPIAEIAERAGFPDSTLIPYGRTKAKVDITALPPMSGSGTLVLVTAMSPTPAGEGKSTVLIGLADALQEAGHLTMVAMREPSQGPVMGIKGGAAGGGYAQVVPMEDINLHFTGDFHAVAAATNTLAALIDNHIHQGNTLGIDPRRVTWKRCVDVNDRALREIVVGLGGPTQGMPRQDGFDITAASEIMAILCLATDLEDLQERLGRIVIGQTFDKQPVTANDLGASGALTALMRDALNPNLVQTLGGTPTFVHGGPFANIAHGCNSLIATSTALAHADIVLTEAGFGADLGAEKFFDIKVPAGDLPVGGVVIVATIRSLKYNGGVAKADLTEENLAALRAGVVNLERHVDIIRGFGVEPVIALNRFASDTDAERAFLAQWADEHLISVVDTDVWASGGAGAAELAETLIHTMQAFPARPKRLYDPEDGVEQALRTVATTVYHAADVRFSAAAQRDLAFLKANGWDRLPVCISKTPYSFSDDPTALGAARGHALHVRALIPRIGAGFIVALTGDVMTLPGLPKQPAALGIDVAADGTISGLF